MTDLTKATAAPVSLTIGGETYKLHPFRLVDWGELQQALRERVIDLGRRQMEKAIDPAVAERVMEMAFERAERLTLASPATQPLLSSPDMAVLAIWLSMRQANGSLTLPRVEALCEEIEDVGAVVRQVIALSRGDQSDADGEADGAPDPSPT